MSRGIILQHTNEVSTIFRQLGLQYDFPIFSHLARSYSYDFLIRKHRFNRSLKRFLLENVGYSSGCEVVDDFLKEHKGYKYVCSEDTGHTCSSNRWIIRFIEFLHKSCGFEQIFIRLKGKLELYIIQKKQFFGW